jgi:hypothetical protein
VGARFFGRPTIVAQSLPGNPAAADAASTISLGIGNSPGPRTIATVHVSSFKSAQNAPCGFQAQGTHWSTP